MLQSASEPARSEPHRVVPIVRLSLQHFTVNRGDALKPQYEDAELPVVTLSFAYGEQELDADDLGLDNLGVVRDHAREREARLALESLGAVDLDCLETHGRDLLSRAHYLVSLDEDPSAYCAFTASAVPELRRRGYTVEIEPTYPYRLIQSELSWYAELSQEEERPNWFDLTLGVQIDGQRVNLVPVLLQLLEQSGEIASLRALERGTEKLLVVPVGTLGYARVSPDWLKRVWAVLLELYARGKDAPLGRRELTQGHAVRALDQAFEQAGCTLQWDSQNLEELARDRAVFERPAPIAASALPVQATLRPYQLEGVAWLQHLKRHAAGGVLADDMGLGKTLQTITHLALEHTKQPLLPPSLIVCPTSLVGNWQRELTRFAPQLRVCVYHGKAREQQREWLDAADVIVTSYPILLRDAELLEPLAYHVLVLDEAQAIK
ncbi:MAG TPA: SNF2-related protein, partial [Polyangiales bacterium]